MVTPSNVLQVWFERYPFEGALGSGTGVAQGKTATRSHGAVHPWTSCCLGSAVLHAGSHCSGRVRVEGVNEHTMGSAEKSEREPASGYTWHPEVSCHELSGVLCLLPERGPAASVRCCRCNGCRGRSPAVLLTSRLPPLFEASPGFDDSSTRVCNDR